MRGVQEGVKRFAALLLVLLLPLLAAENARSRMEAISAGKLRRGAVVIFRSQELLGVGQEELEKRMPGVVSDLSLTLGNGWAAGSGNVDFLRLQRSWTGEDAGFVLRRLLGGVRPVTVRVRLSSAGGRARVDVERVTVSGIVLEGAGLEFLVRAYVRTVFPDAVQGEWFPLDPHLEQVALEPGRAVAVVK